MDYLNKKIRFQVRRLTVFTVICGFFLSLIVLPLNAQSELNLPVSGVAHHPAVINGMTIHPEDPFLFDFIIHPGDDALQGDAFKEESTKLIKYFMAALTVPEDEMWVNLSPYEKDRIIPKGVGNTDMGKDLLAQDYVLKQLTASLMNPDHQLGSEFWQRVYARVQEEYGSTDLPMNTFNKIWIVPDKVVFYQNGVNIFVVESRFKVMLEEDYLALDVNRESHKHGLGDISEDKLKKLSELSSKVIKEIILPEIEREVNEGKSFANLRQIFHSVILAHWYKKNIKQGLLNQVYINQNKTDGINIADKDVIQRIYDQYVQAFNAGAYTSMKDDYDPSTQGVISRQYFSGGIDLKEKNLAMMSQEIGGNVSDKLVEGAWRVEVAFQNYGNSNSVKITRPLTVEEMLESFNSSSERQPISGQVMKFVIPSEVSEKDPDVYNITSPKRVVLGIAGRETEVFEVIAGRVEARESEDARSMFFEKKDSEWVHLEGTPVFNLQDPFMTTVIDPVTGEQDIIFGGVEAWMVSENESRWKTVFYRGKSLTELTRFTESAEMMKDVRIVQIRDGKVLVAYRSPQGGRTGFIYRDEGLPLLGFRVIDKLDDLPEFITNDQKLREHLIPEIFELSAWGGVNDMDLLEDGRVGVIGHLAHWTESEQQRPYYSMSFILDPRDKSVENFKIILTLNSLSKLIDLEGIPLKQNNMFHIIFSGGLYVNGTTSLFVGARDVRSIESGIAYPYGAIKIKPYTFDNAALARDVGGVDLNPNISKTEFKGRSENFDFEFKNLANVTTNINGLTPAILKISPVTNIPFLLGEASK